MSCCHLDSPAAAGDTAFTVDASRITFGRGCIAELGPRARGHGLSRVALFGDPTVAGLPIFAAARASLRAAGLDVVEYTDVRVEPTDASFADAVAFATAARPDGYVSVGGGSVIDTAKAANLYASHPADLLAYVNAPVGEGRAVPGPLAPHIACPTTSGTGSEVTGIAVFDLLSMAAKTGIANPALRPTEALIDPDATDTLPSTVVACSGLDVLSHALESYTARPYTRRPVTGPPERRPASQGANPWSDFGAREALRLLGRYLQRAVADGSDRRAREQTMWAATLAGIAFGNAGVHVPHAMAYAVAGLVRDFHPADYPGSAPMVPHGMAVIVNAPAVFRALADTDPARHLAAAGLLAGRGDPDAGAEDAGEVLAAELVRIIRALELPNGLTGLGYRETDCAALVDGSWPQQRLLQNAPRDIDRDDLAGFFGAALRYW
ncbi:hydroxyacid-oxoacid transhydrogenase [Mycolicibacterium fallax]|mgnify:CR=1 FL=1|jgi:alcohol dehydrogenase class IV|uniref:hydroxyacid-oxoacid transhydrogenase n=1 Tax=Mycolicibacterium fallax TaxID=1793 RepID=A0A1X1RJH8_MYCFA|nr:hydroxyacid-oxoacid transhydrogenase [Mycolicibacterium fallax]ORV07748.1 alcohol dehydrogenase [Mycolicibacterium fallax]BBY99180.1 alcohol dehydrogenase [Mycolicibacterium fallax]